MKLSILLFFVVFSFSAFAATTATINLRGSVPRLLEISAAQESIANTLPLDTTQNDTLIATVTEKSNSATGYTVNVTSINQGRLVHETENSSVVNYVLKYNGSVVDLASGGSNFSEATRGVKTRDVTISYTGLADEDLVEGDYTDVITLTISAN